MRHLRVLLLVQTALCLPLATLAAGWPQQSAHGSDRPASAAAPVLPNYVLGPDDVIAIRAMDAEEISAASLRIDPNGELSLPLIGRVTAAGLTIHDLEKKLASRLKPYVLEPMVAVTVVEYRSQPVSMIGEVGQPGVHQLEGRKNLIEVLAKAGGLRPEAGNIVKITRRIERGQIPLPSAVTDPTGQFSVAEVELSGIIRATRPEDNILIQPDDVISVPRATLVYVIGEVKRPGGFTLNERRMISGLHALAVAQGFTETAAPDKAVVIRTLQNGDRTEIAANLRDILSGKARDVELLPDDILFVPNSASRSLLSRSIQTAVSAITSATIYAGLF